MQNTYDRLIKKLDRIREDPALGTADKKAVGMAAGMIRKLQAMAEARVLTADEVNLTPAGSVLWEEMYDGYDGSTRIYPVLVDSMGRIGDTEVSILKAEAAASMGPDEDGCRLRWWSRKPTDEEREEWPWETKSPDAIPV